MGFTKNITGQPNITTTADTNWLWALGNLVNNQPFQHDDNGYGSFSINLETGDYKVTLDSSAYPLLTTDIASSLRPLVASIGLILSLLLI